MDLLYSHYSDSFSIDSFADVDFTDHVTIR